MGFQFWCQVVLMLLFSVSFFFALYKDFKRANGFSDVVITFLVAGLHAFLAWGAGALSRIF
jgi:hypothetical protein